MVDNTGETLEAYKQMKKSAFVLGWTGEVGKELVKELAKSKVFTKVALIGRRNVEFNDDRKDFEQVIIDFEKTDGDELVETFSGYDVGFTCLGTTRGKSGADGFRRIDHDYIVNTARLAKSGGCKHFHLVSSMGANHNSRLLYPQVKGQVEEEIKEMNFERLSIYRPGMLMCDREESRFGEKVAHLFAKPIAALFPKSSATTSTLCVAQAMIYANIVTQKEKVKFYYSKEMLEVVDDMSDKK